MRHMIILAALGISLSLGACDKKAECTAEQAQAKSAELMTKIQTLAQTNPEKLAALAPKLTELQAKAANAGADPAAACAMIEELTAELEK